MKHFTFLIAVLFALVFVFATSCAEDDDGDTGDTASNATTDTGSSAADSDSGSAASTDQTACGGENAACCAGDVCSGTFLPVPDMTGQCICRAACTFSACTAGTQQGYCTQLFGLEGMGCYNVMDFPAISMDGTPPVENECTVGEVCTSDSGDANGMCMSLPNPMATDGSTLTRCIVSCDTPPSACADATLVCSPMFDMTTFTADYSNAYCGPAM